MALQKATFRNADQQHIWTKGKKELAAHSL